MTEEEKYSRLVPLGQLGRWLAKYGDLWQMKLLEAEELYDFARKRGLRLWRNDTIKFWQLGLLKADLVVSKEPFQESGFIEAGQNRGGYLYADERTSIVNFEEWPKESGELGQLKTGVKLLFHPFRYNVLYDLERILKTHIIPSQIFYPQNRFHELLTREIEEFQIFYSSSDFWQALKRWNDITSLCVAIEPYLYGHIFDVISINTLYVEEEDYHKLLEEYWQNVSKVFENLEITRIEEIRGELCRTAYLLEPNKEIQLIARLMHKEPRLKLEGTLGGSVILRTMAEMLRLATEKVKGIQLLEEDHLTPGFFFPQTLEELFGSTRLLDGHKDVAKAVLSHYGLNFGVKIRWYVEGPTEYGALAKVFNTVNGSSVELKDLNGRVVEKSVLAFRDSLRKDIIDQVFSFVSLDGDREDNLRAIRKAATDDEIFGAFFISKPDFEFANFTISELEEVARKICLENGASDEALIGLPEAIKDAKSGKEFIHKLPSVLKPYLNKSQKWGEDLIEFALANPQLPNGDARPIVEAIQTALRVISPVFNLNYTWHRQNFRVDPKEGQLIPRTKPTTDN